MKDLIGQLEYSTIQKCFHFDIMNKPATWFVLTYCISHSKSARFTHYAFDLLDNDSYTNKEMYELFQSWLLVDIFEFIN